MKIAYIVLAHKLPDQLIRLVKKLNNDTTDFFIHIDKKTNKKIYKKIFNALNGYKNVHFVKRHKSEWGAFGIVSATLEGIRGVLAQGKQYDYINLITGQDYPIKSNQQIEKTLQENYGKSFVEYFPLPSKRWKGENEGMDRLTHRYFTWRGRRISLTNKKPFRSSRMNKWWLAFVSSLPLRPNVPDDIQFFGGSAYWTLTQECVEYIDAYARSNHRIMNFFRHILIPDEIFFQTILMNSDHKEHIVQGNLRYIIWNEDPHPEMLQKKHYKELMSTDKLFARKFDMTIDADVLDMIDNETQES